MSQRSLKFRLKVMQFPHNFITKCKNMDLKSMKVKVKHIYLNQHLRICQLCINQYFLRFQYIRHYQAKIQNHLQDKVTSKNIHFYLQNMFSKFICIEQQQSKGLYYYCKSFPRVLDKLIILFSSNMSKEYMLSRLKCHQVKLQPQEDYKPI